MENMDWQIENLKQWAENTRKAKEMELEAVMRFIIRNQKYDAFYDSGEARNEGRGRQGKMFIDLGNQKEAPELFVNWDEVCAFDDQKELFEELFEGDFSSDKIAKITGIKP